MSTIIIMKKGLLKTRQSKNTKMKVQVKRSDSPNKLQKEKKKQEIVINQTALERDEFVTEVKVCLTNAFKVHT